MGIFQKVFNSFLINVPKETGYFLRKKYVTLVLYALISLSICLLYAFSMLFVSGDTLQGSILLIFAASFGLALYIVYKFGWIEIPSLIIIIVGLLGLSFLYLVTEGQVFASGIWFLVYIIFAVYFFPIKKSYWVFLWILGVLFLKHYFMINNLTIIEGGSIFSADPYIDQYLLLGFCLAILSSLVVGLLNTAEQATSEIEVLVNEQELLIQEVHHRVKNNLQVITSLIALQKHKIKNSEHADILNNVASRIAAMALSHELLYSGDSMSSLRFGAYVSEIGKHVLELYKSKIQLEIKTAGEDYELSLDGIVPLGLMFNELITNSIKYSGAKEGKIQITCDPLDKGHKITYKDAGINKLPDDLLHSRKKSLGTKLIVSLTRQMGGTIEQQPLDQGFGVVLILPKSQKFVDSAAVL